MSLLARNIIRALAPVFLGRKTRETAWEIVRPLRRWVDCRMALIDEETESIVIFGIGQSEANSLRAPLTRAMECGQIEYDISGKGSVRTVAVSPMPDAAFAKHAENFAAYIATVQTYYDNISTKAAERATGKKKKGTTTSARAGQTRSGNKAIVRDARLARLAKMHGVYLAGLPRALSKEDEYTMLTLRSDILVINAGYDS